jgi:NADPH-dependent glutamate synthase beta subunit-like oxidoreductase
MVVMANESGGHYVAVIGGATAGAEVASRLADRGVSVVVFEQNLRPYGKIEDGLPRWHEALRQKEYRSIDEKLSRPGVSFVPDTRIGRDIDFKDLVENWGFSAVVLANGAWRDRPLPVEGADDYVGRGLVYQNPFVIAFNHADLGDLEDASYTVHDGALIVGGGLASIDVAKIHTLELTVKKLAERGIETSILELEVKGIPKVLAAHDLEWEDLALEGPTIFYRRRIEDMPLMEIPEGADEARKAKVEAGRRRMIDKALDKYRFKIEPLCAPDGLLVENGQLVGLRFRRTKIENGRVVMTDETFERRGPAIISSIGSIPEPIEGIAMKGELFDFKDWDIGKLEGYPTVFSVGNVVTGKGNIVASRKHAAHVSQDAIESYLGVTDDDDDRDSNAEARPSAISEAATALADQISETLAAGQAPSAEKAEALCTRVAERQRVVGFDDYKSWREKVGPAC